MRETQLNAPVLVHVLKHNLRILLANILDFKAQAQSMLLNDSSLWRNIHKTKNVHLLLDVVKDQDDLFKKLVGLDRHSCRLLKQKQGRNN